MHKYMYNKESAFKTFHCSHDSRLRGLCTLKSIFLILIFFLITFISNVCIYTLKSKNFKNSSRGCATPPNVPKLDVSGVKDTAKTNKD